MTKITGFPVFLSFDEFAPFENYLSRPASKHPMHASHEAADRCTSERHDVPSTSATNSFHHGRTPTAAPAASSRVARVLILNANRLFGECLQQFVKAVLAAATTLIACSAAEADALVGRDPIDLLITDVVAADGDVLDRLPRWMGPDGKVKRAFIVTGHKEPGILHTLPQLPIEGVFDQETENMAAFSAAISQIASGSKYWSPSYRDGIIRQRLASNSVFQLLTDSERMVLGVIGDGSDDVTAAGVLGLAANTIRSVRCSLHRKLHVQQKTELIARAADYGFVIKTKHGTIRPGLSSLVAAKYSAPVILQFPHASQSVA